MVTKPSHDWISVQFIEVCAMVALACYCKIVAKSGGSTLQQFCHSVCNGLDMWPPFSGVTACHPLANSLSMPLANKFLKEEALLFLRIHPVCSGKIFSAIAGLVEAKNILPEQTGWIRRKRRASSFK